MSSVADSPVHSSSSSEDFAAFLDSHLDGTSPSSDSESEAEKQQKLEADSDSGEQSCIPKSKRVKVHEEETVEEIVNSISEASSSGNDCAHPGTFGGLCISCGKMLNDESGVTFSYVHKGLRLGNDEIVRLRSRDIKALQSNKKLYLVLDLDHTLLNSTHIRDILPEEEYLKVHASSLQDGLKGSLFILEVMGMMTKLRPFVRTFLEEVNKLFEMYIYTMGERAYAQQMAKLLDPNQEYFAGRVISRDDGTGKHEKRLDIVLGQESAVLILDDTELAWSKHKENLILVERYHYFSSSCRQFNLPHKSLSERKHDEREHDGALATVLEVLKRVHNKYFEGDVDNHDSRDVRKVLMEARKEVLKGCKIVFSHIFPTESRADCHPLWLLAEELGAECFSDVQSSVTHVVTKHCGTEKSKWALKHNKFTVNPSWIEAARFFWQRPPEENFPVQ